MVSACFPLPGVKHGKRILTSVIEARAQDGLNTLPWMSVPIDNQDLSRGYQDITFQQLNNAANHAARWLCQNLPASTEPFQCFAYAGPKDVRYAILAVAAAKLQKVMVLPSPLITTEAQLLILAKKNCTVYLRPQSMTAAVAAILQNAPHVQSITVPEPAEFLLDATAEPTTYAKMWEEGKDDPWLVFHTSGTTGNPKPITYTHQMMASVDIAASLSGIEETHIHQYSLRRWYTPLPSLHFVGMVMSLAMTAFLHMTAVTGPPGNHPPDLIAEILQVGHVDGALLPPSLIESLALFPAGVSALQNLSYLHYAGAPLSTQTGNLLSAHTRVVPCIGSTEAGGYFTVIHADAAWSYISFQSAAGASFEHRMNGLHELVFIRRPECAMQQIFYVYGDRDCFETGDLWVRNEIYPDRWRIVGRSDDYVCLSHGDGLHASLLEMEIAEHPEVKAALVGGDGRAQPVLTVELVGGKRADAETEEALVESLQPYIDKVNAHCHESVRLSLKRLIFATKEKPFIVTVKGSVARLPTLALYEDEVAALFA
ncbi:hypothetical protein BDV06DRAFT_230791 [Aspergillus oleicola]